MEQRANADSADKDRSATMTNPYLGVDVSKAWIDVFDPITRKTWRIAMTPEALDSLAGELASRSVVPVVVCEATGGCERPLLDALARHRVGCARVNPRQAREFARTRGILAKTDAVDARVLADMGATLQLRPDPPADPDRRRLGDLVARRDALTDLITQEKLRLGTTTDAVLRADLDATIAFLQTRRKGIEAEITRHVRAVPELARMDAALRQAPGIGAVVAATLVANLPELGHLDRRALASLAGLAPHACDSGIRRGTRHIWGGRATVRRALYMAAFVASQRDPDLKAFRQRLQNEKKPFKVAIVATARKLLTRLNAMIASGQPWQSTTHPQPT